MEKALEIKGLSKSIGKKKIVDDLSFTVQKGEIFGLLGPNGAGKTTTIRMIVGLISKTKGSVIVDGVDAECNFLQAMMKIGAIVENPEMFNYLTGYQNLIHFARMARRKVTNKRIDEVVRLVELQNALHRKVKTYSLGMKQRLGVAQAILHRPSVLILDEPTNGLDPQGIYEFRAYLRLLAQEGTSVIVSSHLLSEMQLMCDRVAIIQHGKLISINTVGALTEEKQTKRAVQFEIEAAEKAQAVLTGQFPETEISIKDTGIELMIERTEIAEVNETLVKSGIKVFGISSRKATLEDTFLEMTKAGEIQ